MRTALPIGLSLLMLLSGTVSFAAEQVTRQPFATNPDAPVEVTSDSLDIDENKGRAVFLGDPRMVQGDVSIVSRQMIASWEPGNFRNTDRIRFQDQVVATSADGRVARGQWGEYFPDAERMIMGDQVTLTQPPSDSGRQAAVLTGKRLEVDMRKGESQLFGDATERAKGVLSPGQKNQTD
jgi:lipopolysaccharide export system protein LptA